MIKPTATLNLAVDRPFKVTPATMHDLMSQQVLVGVPQEKTARQLDPNVKTKATNALLARVHDLGSPLKGIPARPFLGAGIKEGKDKIVATFRKVGEAALQGKPVDMNPVGLVAVNAVRAKITHGPFKPLKPATLRARRKRGFRGTKPLIETGQLRGAQTYVIVKK